MNLLTIKIYVVIYLIISVCIGIHDLYLLWVQEQELMQYPVGDIGYYVFPKKITGVHNWIFLPSWLVIKVWILIARGINHLR